METLVGAYLWVLETGLTTFSMTPAVGSLCSPDDALVITVRDCWPVTRSVVFVTCRRHKEPADTKYGQSCKRQSLANHSDAFGASHYHRFFHVPLAYERGKMAHVAFDWWH
ncbi:hypothetical protein VTK73DRAFT_5246 [Phialemonium thermophilum]|uniref:Secreted protein n=1 Tax=Phialemonium thermophilum TaxID=223376 RepID=A0ABR3WPP3_9PEZI